MNLKFNKLFCICTFFFSKSIFSFDPVLINGPLEEKSLSKHIYILKDETKKLTIFEIQNKNDSRDWIKNRSDSPNLGFTNQTIWIKVVFQNQLNDNVKYLLEVDFSRIDNLDLFVQTTEKLEKFSAGNLVPFETRNIKYRNPIYPIQIQKNDSLVIFMRMESQTLIQFPLKLYSEEKLQEKINKEQLLNGIHFGITILSILLGILLFKLIKDWSNLYFSLYSSLMLFLILIMTGMGFQYLWPKYPFVNHWNSFLIFLSIAAGLQFFRTILNMEKHSALAMKTLNWLTVISLISFFANFFLPFSIGGMLGMGLTLISTAISVILAFSASFKSYKPGIYLTIVSIVGLTEWSMRILHNFAIINFEFSFSDTIILRCVERLIVCLALIAKVELIKEENDRSQIKRLEDEVKTQERLSRLNAEMEIQVKERTKDLEKEKEIAIKANQLKNTFITTVSHDLKSPILNTKNILDILIQNESMNWEERLYYLQLCQGSLTSSYQMIYNILNLDQFDSGNIEIKHQYVNLNPLLKNVIKELEYSYKSKGITINLKAKEEIVVIGDLQLLTQLFLNLLANAIKFSFEKNRIEIIVQEIQNQFQIEIKDFGIGMNELEKHNLLSNYSFSSQGTVGEIGTGFGMRIIQQILSLHDGSLEIKSEKGKGSSFYTLLPCQEKLCLCFTDEDFFSEFISNNTQMLDIRKIRIYEVRNLFVSIQDLNPDYILISMETTRNKDFNELMRISQIDSISTIPIFIHTNENNSDDILKLKFTNMFFSFDKPQIQQKLQEFLDLPNHQSNSPPNA